MTAPVRPALTARQQQVLGLLADGLTHDQAARRLGVSKAALNDRLREATRKLGAITTPQAVLLACRAGILDGRPLLRHGDHAGYEAHRKRRIPYCNACVEGEKTYRADLKARQEAQEAA